MSDPNTRVERLARKMLDAGGAGWLSQTRLPAHRRRNEDKGHLHLSSPVPALWSLGSIPVGSLRGLPLPGGTMSDKMREALERLEQQMGRLVEGNFGPSPWQAGFPEMRAIADEARSELRRLRLAIASPEERPQEKERRIGDDAVRTGADALLRLWGHVAVHSEREALDVLAQHYAYTVLSAQAAAHLPPHLSGPPSPETRLTDAYMAEADRFDGSERAGGPISVPETQREETPALCLRGRSSVRTRRPRFRR
jgi:hypothetical protein